MPSLNHFSIDVHLIVKFSVQQLQGVLMAELPAAAQLIVKLAVLNKAGLVTKCGEVHSSTRHVNEKGAMCKNNKNTNFYPIQNICIW